LRHHPSFMSEEPIAAQHTTERLRLGGMLKRYKTR
jgi:hypothetical protein